MTKNGRNLSGVSTYGRSWFIKEPDGTLIRLPPCSTDYFPSKFWFSACLHDPVGPICRRHRMYFKNRNRKVADG